MSYVLNIGGKKRAVARYIGLVRRTLLQAVIRAEEEKGVSRSDIARKIDCHRSRITRQLRGNSDLTLRSIAEIAWAIGQEPRFDLRDMEPANIITNGATITWDDEEELQQEERQSTPAYGTSTLCGSVTGMRNSSTRGRSGASYVSAVDPNMCVVES